MTKRKSKEIIKNDYSIGYIYILIFPNNKIYVGQTAQKFNYRMIQHKNMKKHYKNKRLYYAIKKYNWNSITKKILIKCYIKDLDIWERTYISLYDSTNIEKGYNLESGGHKNKTLHESTIELIKKNHANVSGKNNPMYGKKGKLSPGFGKYGKLHLRSKIVYQYDLNGNFIKEWQNACEIERDMGWSSSNISSCCLNKHKTNYGYVFSYKKLTKNEILNKIKRKYRIFILDNNNFYKNKIEVYQYNLEGNFVKKWNSLREIYNNLKIDRKHLRNVLLKEKLVPYKSYIFSLKLLTLDDINYIKNNIYKLLYIKKYSNMTLMEIYLKFGIICRMLKQI